MTTISTETTTSKRQRSSLTTAFADPCFPCNPIPFAQGLADFVREHGTDSIKSDDAKSILWVIMAQAFGQLARIDLMDEFSRLDRVRKVQNGGA